ncbi:Asp23/Gls24 family envelope stress response protein [Mycolicibacterium baixiangningiae]|uniref:alkaline shock response membrane anchor protein AmaP n=1 Tax=Mycolicibacterium baixiangningiae TaxID=2761578 RepID=UPI00186807DB|nr:alkaline shock response membrane anchor protein AmaP [Mycolicibacterium baixiangningiae]
MTRLASTWDRFAALVFGLAAIVLGAGMLMWATDWIPGTPEYVTAPGLVTAAGTAWWPWAVGAVGIVLILLALRWLLIHTPKARVKAVPLTSGQAGGRVSADLGAVAHAAAQILEQHPGVESAKGKAVIDRGVRTVDLTVTARSPLDLDALLDPIDTVCAQTAGVVGDPGIATRTTVRIDHHRRREHRVE